MGRFFIVLVLAVTGAVSCVKTTSEYTTDGTGIHITPVERLISASYVKVKIELDNDRNYYYCGILPDTVYQPRSDNSRFMQLMLDSNYKEYINWRYDLLVRNEKYIASFASHCLRYGNNDWHFAGLKHESRYMVYAFCVNPETIQPVGELYFTYLTTKEVKESDLKFAFDWKMQGYEAHVTVMPSNDEDLYVWRVVSQEELDKDYKGNLHDLVYSEVAMYEDYQMIDQVCCKGFSDRNYGTEFFEAGEYYIVYAVGYDGVINTEIDSAKFIYPFEIHSK